ncbi:hypothetical protein [Flavobacterium terrigena]|nr:hypothetical protein [Flavobacterium terrigena]
MKKILFIIACSLQFVNAQTKPSTGEYLSIDKTNQGINLFLNDDKTFQMFVLNGTYEVINDSIKFSNDLSNELKNAFNVQFKKSKTANKKVNIFIEPAYLYSRPSYFLGIQNKADGEITYKTFNEYFDRDEIERFYEQSYSDKKEGEEENTKMSFELDKPYAIYVVRNLQSKAKIEKYIISSDVSEVKIESNTSIFDEFEMTGVVENEDALKVYVNKTSPLKFVNKKAKIETKNEIPATKTTEKNWTYPGKKDFNDIYADSAAVVVDTAAAYSDTDYQFKAKVEKNLKEALVNIKKDPAKYLFVYYNPKGKRTEKDFKNLIEEYNINISNTMYSEYDAAYDKFNFYLATKSDEGFFKKNNVTDKSFLILNKDGKIIATSTKSIDQISNTLNYDSAFLSNKLLETENAITLSNTVTNKKTSIPDLTKTLNTNYKDLFTSKYYYNLTSYTEEEPIIEEKYDENEDATTEAAAVVEAAADAYENKNFTYYKSEVSEKILTEKLNTIFEYYNSKNIVNSELVNILLGEISGNHNSFDLFKNENNTNNKQEIKFINYILKYNEDEKKKVKIATILSSIISEKAANNPDIQTYNDIAYKLISYSGNNLGIIQNAINNFNTKEKASEEANKLVDIYYNTLVNNKPVFENIDTQFNNISADIDYEIDWTSFKNRINTMLNAQAWDIFETNKTKDFERAIKWSELSNLVEKDNPYSLDTLGQLYFAVGKKSEAIAIQTKAVALAKTMKISHEEFENALNNMKK